MQRDLAAMLARVPQLVGNIAELRALEGEKPGVAACTEVERDEPQDSNPALVRWQKLGHG